MSGQASTGVCQGVTALGRCDKAAKFKVNDERSCGVHLAQMVKWHLTFRDEVVVVALTEGRTS